MPASKKTHQHTIPKCYLKYFAEGQHLYLYNLNHEHDNKIVKRGIGDRIFTRKEFYNFPNRDHEPFLENQFQKIESQNYEHVMSNIELRERLGSPTKTLLLDWMIMTKMRSGYFRDEIKRVIHFVESTKYGLINGRKAMEEKENDFEVKSKRISKAIQLSQFLDPKEYEALRDNFIKAFGACEWTILQTSNPNLRFLTNDNPGFSLTLSEDLYRLRMSPYSAMYNVAQKSQEVCYHYFPLSAHLCLEITPVVLPRNKDDAVKKLLQMSKSDIQIKIIEQNEVNKINTGTVETTKNLLIGYSSEDIEPWLSSYN